MRSVRNRWALLWISMAVLVGAVLFVPSRQLATAGPRQVLAEQAGRITALEGGFAFRPVGSVVAWHRDTPGAATEAQINALGWAVCDGSDTSEVPGAAIDPTPDLNGAGLFLRGGSSSGLLQGGQTASHAHALDHAHPSQVSATTSSSHVHGVNTEAGHKHDVVIGGIRIYGQEFNVPDGALSRAIDRTVNAFPLIARNPGSGHVHYTDTLALTHSHTLDLPNLTGTSLANTGAPEVRPANMRIVWIMRVK